MSDPTPRHVIEEAASAARLPASCFRVLLCLLRYRGANATAYPSVATIATQCAIGERTAQVALQALTAAGWTRQVPGDHRARDWALFVGGEIRQLTPKGWKARAPRGDLAPQGATPCGAQGLAAMGARACANGVQGLAPDSFSESSKESSKQQPAPDAPAQALTASPDLDGRAGVEEEQATAPTPRPLPIRPVPVLPVPTPRPAPTPAAEEPEPPRLPYVRPGPLGNAEQAEAALAAVVEPPVPRVPRNLAAHDGPPKRPPTYLVLGKELPGAISELLPPEQARTIAPHFRSDDLRSGTQKLFEAPDLRFLRGVSPVFLVDLAISFDRRWGVRPRALREIAVPYVAYGVDVEDDLCRLWGAQRGRPPTPDELVSLVPDAERRRPIIELLRTLGGGNAKAGWVKVPELAQARKAAK